MNRSAFRRVRGFKVQTLSGAALTRFGQAGSDTAEKTVAQGVYWYPDPARKFGLFGPASTGLVESDFSSLAPLVRRFSYRADTALDQEFRGSVQVMQLSGRVVGGPWRNPNHETSPCSC